MNTYHIGDLVQFSCNYNIGYSEEKCVYPIVGIVVGFRVMNPKVLVEFGDDFNGHDGNPPTKGHRWYCSEGELRFMARVDVTEEL